MPHSAGAERRSIQRIELADPLVGRLGTHDVALVDLSLRGVGVEHRDQIATGSRVSLYFEVGGRKVVATCKIVRTRLDRFRSGRGAITVYRSGLLFDAFENESVSTVRDLVDRCVTRALEEQLANANGDPVTSTEKMPVFRDGVLAIDQTDLARIFEGRLDAPSLMLAKPSYIRCRLRDGLWMKIKTAKPDQPEDGFTVSAQESMQEITMLCDTYREGDTAVRDLVRKLAAASIQRSIDDAIPTDRLVP